MTKKLNTILVAALVLILINYCVGFNLVFASDINYCGAGTFTDESETIYYETKETTSYSIMGDVPSYYSQISNSNCANVAGAEVIGYYDRFCEELIPAYKAYVQIGAVIRYKIVSVETQHIMESLHSLMGTDVGSAGTTYNGFQKGMKSYVNSRGYNYTIADVGNLDFNNYKTAVENNKPVALFLNNYSLAVNIQDNGTNDVIYSQHNSVAHVAIACGYKIDIYYNSNGQIITTRTYLKVASGLNLYGLTYLCLDGKSKIDKATSITIQ